MVKLIQELALKQQLTPQQILQANILQLNIISLEQKIMDELEKNPALEIADPEDELQEEVIPEAPEKETEQETAGELDDKKEETDFDWEELLGDPDEYEIRAPVDRREEEFDMPIRATKTLAEKLMDQFWDLSPSEDEVKIAEELIGNISEDGYLTIDPILIADRMMLPEEKVLSVLKKIQQLEPPGIGARNLQECLLAQINGYHGNPLLVKVLSKYFDDFANKRYNKIMTSTGCTREELQEVIDIVSTLNPRPGLVLGESEQDFIIPDLTVEETDDGWVVQVNDSLLPEFRVNQKYIRMAQAYKNDSDVKKFIKQKVESAKWFIDAINQRHQTMIKVMNAIIFRQPLFFGKTDKRELVPMVLKDVADDVGMDVSTISRVTSGKYVQLPFGIYELKSFFSEGISTKEGRVVSNTVVKDRLRELIENEDKHNPLGDEQLVKLLVDEGYKIARRTVAKYREQMKIPVARLRKVL